MHRYSNRSLFAILMLLLATAAFGQQRIMWSAVDVRSQDLLHGPGGAAGQPNVSSVTFVEEDTRGNSLKYRIRDAKGNEWVAKVGNEAQSETAAVRLLQGLGYKTETVYMVRELTIPGKGTFKNVRLESRPANVDRVGRWAWANNPFTGTKEFEGLKLMMALLNNWDTKDSNNSIIRQNGQDNYVVSDLGSTFGKTGGVFTHTKNKPVDFQRAEFVTGVSNGMLQVVFNGKNGGEIKKVSVEGARWLASLLSQLSDKQIRDAFRSANYSESDVELLTQTVKRRISELQRVTSDRSVGKN